jgi:hypothetical protein
VGSDVRFIDSLLFQKPLKERSLRLSLPLSHTGGSRATEFKGLVNIEKLMSPTGHHCSRHSTTSDYPSHFYSH